MHGPGHDDFPLLLEITVEHRAGHALSANAASCRRAYSLRFGSFDGIRAEIRANITRTNCHHVDSIAHQLNSRCLSESIHRELGRAVSGIEWQGNMSGNARDVGNRS